MRRLIQIVAAIAIAAAPFAAHAQERKETRRTVVVKDGKVYRVNGDDPSGVWITRRGYLGVQMLDLTPELREHFRVSKDAGVLVSKVVPDSPAAKAGLRAGDIITALDGSAVESPGEVARAIRDRKEGTALRIDYSRDGAAATATATVQRQLRKEVDLRDLDIEIPEVGKHLSEYFASPEWKAKMAQLQQLPDCGQMQERMRELEAKMKDLEQRLKQK